MPKLEFEVWCDTCGEGLCSITRVSDNNVYVDPCPECLKTAKEEGHNEGYEEAREEFEDADDT